MVSSQSLGSMAPGLGGIRLVFGESDRHDANEASAPRTAFFSSRKPHNVTYSSYFDKVAVFELAPANTSGSR